MITTYKENDYRTTYHFGNLENQEFKILRKIEVFELAVKLQTYPLVCCNNWYTYKYIRGIHSSIILKNQCDHPLCLLRLPQIVEIQILDNSP